MDKPVTLYGLPHSLYTGKARSYLRKQGIPYREVPPSDLVFAREIVPQIGRGIIPVMVTAKGAVVQDTVEIIDHFERAGKTRHPAYPTDPALKAVSALVELYAVLGLTRHAMHYRWSYLAEQEPFLRDAFGVGGDPERTRASMERMASYLPMLGVNADTVPAIEESYRQLLDTLEAHFAQQPYLLGARPSIGDYALFGPLFAHLGRDPVPLTIMQQRAPKVFRWVERMHAPDLDTVEYPGSARNGEFAASVPDTLGPLLDQIAAELLPGLTDRLAGLRDFVAETDPQEGEPVVAKPHQRIVGTADTSFRGVPYRGGVQPYHFLLWQRVQEAAGSDEAAAALFVRHGLGPVLDEVLPIRVERANNIEVWGERA